MATVSPLCSRPLAALYLFESGLVAEETRDRLRRSRRRASAHLGLSLSLASREGLRSGRALGQVGAPAARGKYLFE
jgi:hypothetical protein